MEFAKLFLRSSAALAVVVIGCAGPSSAGHQEGKSTHPSNVSKGGIQGKWVGSETDAGSGTDATEASFVFNEDGTFSETITKGHIAVGFYGSYKYVGASKSLTLKIEGTDSGGQRNPMTGDTSLTNISSAVNWSGGDQLSFVAGKKSLS